MSAFTDLLIEARDILRRKHRRAIGIHFDWDGRDFITDTSWCCWYDDGPTVFGASGEEALRRVVETLRVARPCDSR